MSHDIRTLMNAIVGIAKLMKYELHNPERLKNYLEKLLASCQHLLGLINDILDITKIESGSVTLHKESVNLKEQIEKIDAVKYTPNGGMIHFEIREETAARASASACIFTITDNGMGMTPEFQKVLFDTFTRAEDSVTNKIQGTGLGMAITKNIVEMMEGTITVDSAPGKGSRFEVRVLLEPDASVPASSGHKKKNRLSEKDGKSVLCGMKFLCAEDNELNAEILESLLQVSGASCTIYPDGEQIAEAFKKVQPGGL